MTWDNAEDCSQKGHSRAMIESTTTQCVFEPHEDPVVRRGLEWRRGRADVYGFNSDRSMLNRSEERSSSFNTSGVERDSREER